MVDYTYKRKDGGKTVCYGKVEDGANYSVACENEWYDCIISDIEGMTTWRQVCKHLEKWLNPKIEQIETC